MRILSSWAVPGKGTCIWGLSQGNPALNRPLHDNSTKLRPRPESIHKRFLLPPAPAWGIPTAAESLFKNTESNSSLLNPKHSEKLMNQQMLKSLTLRYGLKVLDV